MRTCSIEGCGKKHQGNGYCVKHNYSFNRYGDPLKSKTLDPNREIDWASAPPLQGVNGYIHLQRQINKKIFFKKQHIYIWECANGAIPDGYQIHHINGLRDDNRLENLICVDRNTHSRIHAGWQMADGEWLKCCPECGILKSVIKDFYKHRTGGSVTCKLCRKIRRRRKISEGVIYAR